MDQLKIHLQSYIGTEIQTFLKCPSMVEVESPSVLLDDQKLEIITDPNLNVSKDQNRLKVYRLSLEAECGSLVGYVTEFMYKKQSCAADVRELMSKKLALLYPNDAPSADKIRMRYVTDKMPSAKIVMDGDVFDLQEVYVEVLSEKDRFQPGQNKIVYLQEFRHLTRTWNTAAEILIGVKDSSKEMEEAIKKLSGNIEVLTAVENGEAELSWSEGVPQSLQDEAILIYYVDKSKWDSKQMVLPPRHGVKMTDDEEGSLRSRRWLSSRKEKALKIYT